MKKTSGTMVTKSKMITSGIRHSGNKLLSAVFPASRLMAYYPVQSSKERIVPSNCGPFIISVYCYKILNILIFYDCKTVILPTYK
jgi:hypothetical protein